MRINQIKSGSHTIFKVREPLRFLGRLSGVFPNRNLLELRIGSNLENSLLQLPMGFSSWTNRFVPPQYHFNKTFLIKHIFCLSFTLPHCNPISYSPLRSLAFYRHTYSFEEHSRSVSVETIFLGRIFFDCSAKSFGPSCSDRSVRIPFY